MQYFVDGENSFTIDSIIVRLIDGVSGEEELSSSDLLAFLVNGVCTGSSCSYEYNPFFSTNNDFLTYTFKPITKYILSDAVLGDIEYYDTYSYPLIYYRVLKESKYFEVASTFTNLLNH